MNRNNNKKIKNKIIIIVLLIALLVRGLFFIASWHNNGFSEDRIPGNDQSEYHSLAFIYSVVSGTIVCGCTSGKSPVSIASTRLDNEFNSSTYRLFSSGMNPRWSRLDWEVSISFFTSSRNLVASAMSRLYNTFSVIFLSYRLLIFLNLCNNSILLNIKFLV